MWPNIEKYVFIFPCNNTIKTHRQPHMLQSNKQVRTPLTVTQLEFFISVAKQLQSFLFKFQTDAPNGSLLGAVIERPLDGAASSRYMFWSKLARNPKLDPCDKKKQVHCKHVEFRFTARQSLNAVTDNKTISELAVLTFQTECVSLAFSHNGQAHREVSIEVSTCEISLLIESSQDDQLG